MSTAEVTNRFKGLDLVDRLPEELQMEVHNIVQEAVTKTIPKKKKCKKAKQLSEEVLQIAEERREVKGKGEIELQNSREQQGEIRKAFSVINAKKQRKTTEWERLEIPSRKLEIPTHAKMGSIKDRNGMDLTEAEDIKKRWQEYTEELYKIDLHDQDNHNGVITHLEPDILECEVKWALESITTNKASGVLGQEGIKGGEGNCVTASVFSVKQNILSFAEL